MVASELVHSIKGVLLEAIDNDTISLPTLPEVAIEVRKVATNSDASVADLCKVLERDPSVAASVIKVANSPLFRGNDKIENLRAAAARLGTRYTANFATGVAMRQLFQAKTAFINQIMVDTWTLSTEVAATAQLLSKAHPRLLPDRASLAGLTHRIGVLPVLTYAEKHKKLLDNEQALKQLIEEVHQDIGTRILEVWQFPEDIVNVPCDYLNFERDIPQADYADLVTAAVLQGAFSHDHPYANLDLASVKALERLGLQGEHAEQEQAQMVEHIEIAAAAFSH
jgi:HD-like signal output (HDOD) protein